MRQAMRLLLVGTAIVGARGRVTPGLCFDLRLSTQPESTGARSRYAINLGHQLEGIGPLLAAGVRQQPAAIVAAQAPPMSYWEGAFRAVFPMPKSGSSSVSEFYRCHGMTTAHWHNAPRDAEGHLKRIMDQGHGFPGNLVGDETHACDMKGKALLECGPCVDMYGQIDVVNPPGHCWVPQITHLAGLIQDYGNATFLLPMDVRGTPLVAMLLLAKSSYLVGNPASTFSVNMADIRRASGAAEASTTLRYGHYWDV